VVVLQELIVVGFSSYACHKCIRVENEYQSTADALGTLGVSWAVSLLSADLT
jgi:hypothetical protein